MRGDKDLHPDETVDSILDVKVIQKKRGYRFSIDSLALASFVLPLKESDRVIDIGTGSGVMPLILAKRSKDTLFWGVELQEGLFELAGKNVELNSLSNRITLIKGDFKDALIAFKSGYFTVLLSNPPYRGKGAYRVSPYKEKAIARYEVRWDIDEFINAGSQVLGLEGRLCLIYPIDRFSKLTSSLKENGLAINRLRFIHPKRSGKAELFLLEAARKKKGLRVEPPIFLEDGVEGLFPSTTS